MGAGKGSAGKRFGKYELVSFIGTSGGASVYRARQANMERLVTLTILPRERAEKPAYRTRFERQVLAASKLRHPNILSALDGGSISGHQYLVSEHVGGRRLSSILRDGEFITVRRAVVIALAVARALAHMDSVGILHRNLTPQSVLIGDADVVKLRGFSFARPHRQSSSETWFEPHDYAALYRAPDFTLHKKLDVRADVYSLGCVLFHMLRGRPPFPAPNAAVAITQHASAPVPDAREGRSDVPDSLVHALAKALEKDRERRYATPDAMVSDLEAVTAGREVEPPRPPRRLPWRRRGRGS